MGCAGEAGRRAIERCEHLGGPAFSEADGWLERPFLTPAHARAIAAVRGWMGEAGLAVRLDAIGNLIGRLEASRPGAPTLIIGSHIDTVRNAGRFDGPLGVMLGVEAAAILAARAAPPPFALEVIAFGDEEGSRFPVSMLGSRALTEPLEPAALDMTDGDGVSVAEALAAFGLDPARVGEAARAPSSILAYVEPHIEQGPVLEAEGLPIGIVTGIVGQQRLVARFSGQAGHAGTTPMGLRRDALAAAAEAILAVERVGAAGPAGLVATVGRIIASSAAFNVIVGQVEIGVDVRAASDAVRDAAVAAIRGELAAIAERRGIGVELTLAQGLPASPCDGALTARLEAAVRAVGVAPRRLVSGAGHDAMTIARLAPSAMLFIRCAGGISHNPAESASAADADIALRALIALIDSLAEDFA